MKSLLEIDATQGEGGGQVLRTALALSILTQTPIHLRGIRAKRSKLGLMRQHLTCVHAAASISQAEVSGAELGSKELRFTPGSIVSGDYEFAIGTAGSCSLVLQTVLWPLLFSDKPSQVKVSGGTHVPMAPTFEFLQNSFLGALATMGVQAELALLSHGFYPAGGGQLALNTQPWHTRSPLALYERGELEAQSATAIFANLPVEVAQRELAEIKQRMNWPDTCLHHQGLRNKQTIGNAILLSLQFAQHTQIISACGEKQKTSREIAANVCQEALAYLASDAAVDEHLADQLLIPIALVGGGFTCEKVSLHTKTNLALIEKFLPVEFSIREETPSCYRIEAKL